MLNSVYRLLKPILFQFQAEKAHHITMKMASFGLRIPILSSLIRSSLTVSGIRKPIDLMGLEFRNRVGLAAGFDKDGKYLNVLSIMGFGFIELGTVTPKAQLGNDKPRLFRLKKDGALINRMGFNNDGVDALVERLKVFKKPEGLIIGGNIGKNKITPNDEAVEDYKICFEKLHDYVDYFVVNVSSPNTPGLRELQNRESLLLILSSLQKINKAKAIQRPIMLKISPDLTDEALAEIIDLINELQIAGVVSSNTSILRENLKTSTSELNQIGNGGLSGAPIFDYSNNMLRKLKSDLSEDCCIIGVGGIDTPDKALKKLELGANLIQIYSGMIYYGPGLVKDIVKASA